MGRLLASDDSETDDDDGDDGEVEDPRAGFQRIIWTVDTDQPVAALTFDDGPHPRLTPRILDILDRRGIKATFMLLGYAAEQHPQLVAEVLAAGHEIGHHTWSHRNLAHATVEQTRHEIEAGARAVSDVAGVDVRLFRPPKGRLSEAALRLVARNGHDIVLWSVTRGALDWRSPHRVADHIVDDTVSGSIIDLHDGIGWGTLRPTSALAHELLERRLTEIEGLPRILDRTAERGIQLGRVSDLLALRQETRV